MSLLVVGSIALDTVKTPVEEHADLVGGSASYAAVGASFFSPVKLVGVVGQDFPKKYLELYRRHEIDLEGLQILPGKTFHWSGEYEVNMNNRRTLATELGVFETFNPRLPESYQNSQFVLLANIAPSLQSHVLSQMRRPKFVVADTMDLWLNIALPDLLKLLKNVDGFVLNDSEARQLTKEDNLMNALKKSTSSARNTSSSRRANTGRCSLRNKDYSFRRLIHCIASWTRRAREIRSWAE